MNALLLYRAAALVTLAVVVGAIDSAVRPISLKLQMPAPLPVTKGSPSSPLSNPPAKPVQGAEPAAPAAPVTPPPAPAAVDPEAALNISLAQAKELYDQRTVFLDARHLEEYEQGHVAGALLLNTETFATAGGGEVISMLDREAPIVVYCGGGMCDASKNLVRLLQQSGFMGGRIFHDGYPEWVKAGYPTQTGKPPIGGGS